MSEDVASVTSPDERLDTASLSEWSAAHAVQQFEYCQDFISKGPHKAEVQLRWSWFGDEDWSCDRLMSVYSPRYLLQIMMEASCLEIASIISILLKDALALVR